MKISLTLNYAFVYSMHYFLTFGGFRRLQVGAPTCSKKNLIAMSFAPRDSHEAQVQFALKRGFPAIIGVLGTIKLPYPSRNPLTWLIALGA